MTPPPIKAPALPEPKTVKSTKMNVPIGEIHVLEGLNVRVELTNLDGLIASIEANGFYADKPIAVLSTKDGYIVVDGHRRLAAVHALNERSLDPVITSLPVVVKPTSSGLAAIHIAQVQSATGEPLTMFEKGIAVRRIMADGMSKEDVARAFGVTTKTIDNYIAVASAPAKARDMLLEGKVKETHVLRAVKGKADTVGVLQGMVNRARKVGRAVARASDAVKVPDLPLAQKPETVQRAPDVPPPPQDAVTVDITRDAAMGPVLKAVAKAIRSLVPHDSGEDDMAHVDGVISISVTLAPREADVVPPELAHAIPAEDEL